MHGCFGRFVASNTGRPAGGHLKFGLDRALATHGALPLLVDDALLLPGLDGRRRCVGLDGFEIARTQLHTPLMFADDTPDEDTAYDEVGPGQASECGNNLRASQRRENRSLCR